MSPMTASARQRIIDYLHEHVPANEPPPPAPNPILGMLNDLIAAVRGEQPSDNAF